MLAYVALVSSASAIKGKCPFGFTSGSKPKEAELAQEEPTSTGSAIRYPSEMFTCPTTAVMKTDVDKFGDDEYEAVV